MILDFELLYNCDCLIANLDGPDPDSGTVVEFCFAKMLDMPAVLLRTDFRDEAEIPAFSKLRWQYYTEAGWRFDDPTF